MQAGIEKNITISGEKNKYLQINVTGINTKEAAKV
jgi:hypothetical protein